MILLNINVVYQREDLEELLSLELYLESVHWDSGGLELGTWRGGKLPGVHGVVCSFPWLGGPTRMGSF
jgi:hypothetical protein